MNIKEQAYSLTSSVNDFADYIDSLPENLFLEKIDDWSPRDILAHLIGWNRLTVEGCHQLLKGETPSYFIDPGEDFCKVNATLVKKYNSMSKRKLLDELEVSTIAVKQFLLSLNPGEWDSDHGVSYKGGRVTVRNTVGVLIGEYIQHGVQVKQWVDRVG